jgi:hypothetical protein
MSEVNFNTTPNQQDRSNQGWQLYNERKMEILDNEQVRADFITNTRSIKEILDQPPDERPELKITCIDERAVVFNSNTEGDSNTIHINTPGGGTEFLEDGDIEQIIMKSNGTIRISSHMFCGWGEYVFNEILTKGEDAESEEELLANRLAGITRIISSIRLAVEDSERVFWSNYQDELEELSIVDSTDFTNRARQYLIARTMNKDFDDNGFVSLMHQAFIHGKTIKLATRFRNIHQQMQAKYEMIISENTENSQIPPNHGKRLNISTHIDTLEDAPHTHIANYAVINMTRDRVVKSRHQIRGTDPFFARVGPTKAPDLTELIFKIMEGDHSDTKDDVHTMHIFFDDETIKSEMEEKLKGLLDIKDTRRIVFHLIDEEAIQMASPLPEAV